MRAHTKFKVPKYKTYTLELVSHKTMGSFNIDHRHAYLLRHSNLCMNVWYQTSHLPTTAIQGPKKGSQRDHNHIDNLGVPVG